MISCLMRLIREDAGATAIEYGLIAALIAIAAVSALTLVGSHLSTTFNTIATKCRFTGIGRASQYQRAAAAISLRARGA
jgi:pilus assembly protein Flp/PilA